jgi:hypothetical protein
MTQLTPIGLVKILGQVTAIVAIPMVGGAVAGLIVDAWLGTSPLCVLGGFAIGNLVAIVGIWLFIRSHQRRTDGA